MSMQKTFKIIWGQSHYFIGLCLDPAIYLIHMNAFVILFLHACVIYKMSTFGFRKWNNNDCRESDLLGCGTTSTELRRKRLYMCTCFIYIMINPACYLNYVVEMVVKSMKEFTCMISILLFTYLQTHSWILVWHS